MKFLFLLLFIILLNCFQIQLNIFNLNISLLNNAYALENSNDRSDTYKNNSIDKGSVIELNSLIYVLSNGNDDGYIKIKFDRSDLTSTFLNDVFYKHKANHMISHTFLKNGIRVTLTNDSLILEIFSGVRLHFRNDIEDKPNYKTFINENAVGYIEEINGIVLYSNDKEKLKLVDDMFIAYELGKGSLSNGLKEIELDSELPKKYMPVIEENQY